MHKSRNVLLARCFVGFFIVVQIIFSSFYLASLSCSFFNHGTSIYKMILSKFNASKELFVIFILKDRSYPHGIKLLKWKITKKLTKSEHLYTSRVKKNIFICTCCSSLISVCFWVKLNDVISRSLFDWFYPPLCYK